MLLYGRQEKQDGKGDLSITNHEPIFLQIANELFLVSLRDIFAGFNSEVRNKTFSLRGTL